MSNNQTTRTVNKDDNIIEDGPVMRSVAMVSSRPTTFIQHTQLPSLAKFSPSPAVSIRHENKDTINLQLIDTKKGEDVDAFFASTWKVTNLKPVPYSHTLERTHVCIPDSSIESVTKQITEIIRKLSIAAVYDDVDAKVSCETKCGVRFTLRLWSLNGSIVAECQRSAGCGFTFCQTCKKVLKAAKNGEKAASSAKQSLSLPKCVRNVCPSSLRIPLEDMNDAVIDGLNLVKEMFKSDKVDVKLLAIESLAQDAQSSDAKYRVAFARSLVNSDVFGTVLSLVMYSKFDCNLDEPSQPGTSIEQEHLNMMHRKSLVVLSNCLMTLGENGELGDVVSRIESLDTLLKALVQVVSKASTHPHEASDACLCLKALSSRSNYIKQKVEDLRAPFHAEHAKKLHRHVVLERAAEMLLGELQ